MSDVSGSVMLFEEGAIGRAGPELCGPAGAANRTREARAAWSPERSAQVPAGVREACTLLVGQKPAAELCSGRE